MNISNSSDKLNPSAPSFEPSSQKLGPSQYTEMTNDSSEKKGEAHGGGTAQ